MPGISTRTFVTTLADNAAFHHLAGGINSRGITWANVKSQMASATQTLTNKTITSGTFTGTLTYTNAGAGADPTLASNNAAQVLALTGKFTASLGLEIPAGQAFAINGENLLSESGGDNTLGNINALDATTLATILAGLVGKNDTHFDAADLVPEDQAAGPALATVAGTNVDYEELLFDGAATETAFVKFRAARGSDEGTAIDFVISYAPKGTSSGNVRWEISALAVGDGDTIDAAFGTAVTDDSAAGATANVLQRSGTLTVTPGGTWAAGDDIFLKISRLGGHANDTNTDDVGLINVRMSPTYNALKDN